MRNIFDTHAHYTDDRFRDVPGGPDALLREMFDGDVSEIVNVSVNTRNSLDVVAQAKRFDGMYAAVGVYPEDASAEEGGLDGALSRLRALLDRREENKIVAVGEIGLDYHCENPDKPLQKAFFEAQLRLAEEYGLPVIVHDREAHGDCFDAVLAHPGVRGIFHSFSGSAEMAKELSRRGWYISFSGVITFKNAPRVREAAAAVPLDRLLLETDAPYLAPEPYRGRTNRSDYIAHSAEALGALFGRSGEEMREITRNNAKKLFSIA